MKYSKTTLMELFHRYGKVLKKCALLNMALLMGVVFAMPALAGLSTARMAPMGVAGGDTFQGGGVWVQGFYNHSKQDETSSSEGFTANTRGIVMGVDGKLSDAMTVGFGYAYTDTSADTGHRDIDVDGHNVI